MNEVIVVVWMNVDFYCIYLDYVVNFIVIIFGVVLDVFFGVVFIYCYVGKDCIGLIMVLCGEFVGLMQEQIVEDYV